MKSYYFTPCPFIRPPTNQTLTADDHQTSNPKNGFSNSRSASIHFQPTDPKIKLTNYNVLIYREQPFDSWHTLGASAQSRCRKMHIGVEIRRIGVEFWPWLERYPASNPIRNQKAIEKNFATLVATLIYYYNYLLAFINLICVKKRSTARLTADVLS